MYSLILPGIAVLSVATIRLFLIMFEKTVLCHDENHVQKMFSVCKIYVCNFLHAWSMSFEIGKRIYLVVQCCHSIFHFSCWILKLADVVTQWMNRNRIWCRWFLLSCLMIFWQCLELINFLNVNFVWISLLFILLWKRFVHVWS